MARSGLWVLKKLETENVRLETMNQNVCRTLRFPKEETGEKWTAKEIKEKPLKAKHNDTSYK